MLKALYNEKLLFLHVHLPLCSYKIMVDFQHCASKPINIRWIRTGFQPYVKILSSIALQTIFHEQPLHPLGANKTGFYLILFQFNNSGKLSIIPLNRFISPQGLMARFNKIGINIMLFILLFGEKKICNNFSVWIRIVCSPADIKLI